MASMAHSTVRRWVAGILGALLLVGAPDAVLPQGRSAAFPLRVDAVTVFGEDASLGSAIAGRLAPNGNVYIVDHVNAQIAAFSPQGQLLWKRGRKGDGAGEYQLPYRLGIKPDGTLLVFDLAAGAITALTPEGEFIAKYMLPARFHQLDDLVSITNDEFIAAGVMDLNTPENRFALHRFRFAGERLDYLGSFGPLPVARDPQVLPYWGAGSITLTPAGTVLYARRLPYEVYEFDRAGRQLRMLLPPAALESTPDEFFVFERSGTRITVSSTDSRSQFPGPLVALPNGSVLASRVSNGPDYWDIYTPSGRFAGSREIPEEWGGFLGYDASRGVLWMTGTRNDRPVLFRLRVSSGGASASITRR